jgi:hypothetical protein
MATGQESRDFGTALPTSVPAVDAAAMHEWDSSFLQDALMPSTEWPLTYRSDTPLASQDAKPVNASAGWTNIASRSGSEYDAYKASPFYVPTKDNPTPIVPGPRSAALPRPLSSRGVHLAQSQHTPSIWSGDRTPSSSLDEWTSARSSSSVRSSPERQRILSSASSPPQDAPIKRKPQAAKVSLTAVRCFHR